MIDFVFEDLGSKKIIKFIHSPGYELTILIASLSQEIEKYFRNTECVPAADSILIFSDSITEIDIKNIARKIDNNSFSNHNHHEIKVCYEKEFAPDLNLILEFYNLNKSAFIEFQSTVEYYVAFCGFLPGFAYIKADQLLPSIPRKKIAEPVKRGSVAMASNYCSIYPSNSPGGWQIIGFSAFNNLNLKDNRFKFQIGDTIRYVPSKIHDL